VSGPIPILSFRLAQYILNDSALSGLPDDLQSLNRPLLLLDLGQFTSTLAIVHLLEESGIPPVRHCRARIYLRNFPDSKSQ
jgi:hypothetical protein